MLSHNDISSGISKQLKIELLNYVEHALVIHTIRENIRQVNDVIRYISQDQKNILFREYEKQLVSLKEYSGYDSIEEMLKDTRSNFISKGYFNDGYTVNWLNNFLFLEAFESILGQFKLSENDFNLYSLESYFNTDEVLIENDFIEKIVTAYNRAI